MNGEDNESFAVCDDRSMVDGCTAASSSSRGQQLGFGECLGVWETRLLMVHSEDGLKCLN
jgi:hypothetical protein